MGNWVQCAHSKKDWHAMPIYAHRETIAVPSNSVDGYAVLPMSTYVICGPMKHHIGRIGCICSHIYCCM